MSENQIIYQNAEGALEIQVKLQEESVWLSQEQISLLFAKGRSTITEHIQNIYAEEELEESTTRRKFRQVRYEGSRQVEREIDFYNLDAILSVGYRVNSKQATKFRQWANSVLKNYILNGYALNEKRLQNDQISRIQETLRMLLESKKHLNLEEKDGLLELLEYFNTALQTLDKYDKNELGEVKNQKPEFRLEYNHCQNIIAQTKAELVAKNQATELFGLEYEGKLSSILGSLNQTFGGQELYLSVQEKAANLLYLIIKDHPFMDGNKRLGSFLFVYFLEQNNFLKEVDNSLKINTSSLVSLALLVAQSKPEDKAILIQLIMVLLD